MLNIKSSLAINRLVCSVMLVLFSCNIVYSKDVSPSEVLQILNGNDSDQQFYVLNEIMDESSRVKKPYRTPEIGQAIYELLSRTTKPTDFIKMPRVTVAVLIMRIIGGYQDLRAMPYLLSNIRNGGNILLSLALLGEPGIDPMLAKLKNGDALEQSAACGYFEILFSSKTPTITGGDGEVLSNPYRGVYTPVEPLKEKTRTAIGQSIKSNNNELRSCSIKVLRLIGNSADKFMIEESEKNKPRIKPLKRDPKRLEINRKNKKNLPEQGPIEGGD